jgi:hypothetical protein
MVQKTEKPSVLSTYFGQLLGKAVESSMTIKRGAGGSSLGSSITIRGSVHCDSPAFQLFEKDSWSGLMTSENYRNRMEYVVGCLGMLFTEGKALPTSIDEDGDSLMHVSPIVRLNRLQQK